MKRAIIALLGLCIAAAACGRAGTTPGSGAFPARSQSSGVEKTVGVYAAVIRQLVTKDAPTGGDSEFRRVYVLDGAVDRAENPEQPVANQRPSVPFGLTVKDGLTRALSALPPITFIQDRSSVLTGQPPGEVIGNGILIALGPIRDDGTKAKVGNNYWIGGKAAQWLTTCWRIRIPDGSSPERPAASQPPDQTNRVSALIRRPA